MFSVVQTMGRYLFYKFHVIFLLFDENSLKSWHVRNKVLFIGDVCACLLKRPKYIILQNLRVQRASDYDIYMNITIA